MRRTFSSGHLNLSPRVRLALWALSVLALSVIFFREFWLGLPGMLSPARIFGQNQASPWAVLALWFIFLWLKGKEVRKAMGPPPNLVFLTVGLVVTAAALLMPAFPDYLAFRVLLASLGTYAIFFGRGVKIPAILLAIYISAISFPMLIQRFAQDAYASTVIIPLNGLLTVLGYPFTTEGQWLHLVSAKGDIISVVVTVACAGPATMGVFLSIFALMTLDMPLPRRRAAALLVFGIIGTWFQNLLRVAILMMVAYYMGERAMWTVHSWTIYVLFPLWYLIFAYIYFRQFGKAGRVSQPAPPAQGGIS